MEFLNTVEEELALDAECEELLDQIKPFRDQLQSLMDDFDTVKHKRQHLINGNMLGSKPLIQADRDFTKLVKKLVDYLRDLFE